MIMLSLLALLHIQHYWIATWGAWLVVVCLLSAPFWFNPQTFDGKNVVVRRPHMRQPGGRPTAAEHISPFHCTQLPYDGRNSLFLICRCGKRQHRRSQTLIVLFSGLNLTWSAHDSYDVRGINPLNDLQEDFTAWLAWMRDTYDDGAKCTWESWNREQVRGGGGRWPVPACSVVWCKIACLSLLLRNCAD